MRRAGDWLNAFGAVCAVVWAVGAVVVTADAPPLNPTRERLCADFTTQPAPTHPDLPTEIGPLAQYGAPHWATWMPAFEPIDPALVDTYPACLQDDAVRAMAQSRLDQAWGVWVAAKRQAMVHWALAPLAFAPLLLILALLLRRKPAAASSRGRPRPAAADRGRPTPSPPPTVGAPRGPRRALAPNAPPLRAQLRKDSAPGGAQGTGAGTAGSLKKRNP